MSSETPLRFLCPGCRASFGWKPQYAGRRIRCKCGQVFMPVDPADAGAGLPEPDPYDVDAGVLPPAAVGSAVRTPVALHAVGPAPGAGVAPAVGDRLSGVASLYASHRARPVMQDSDTSVEGSRLKDLYIPVALLVVGTGLRVAQLLVANESRANKWGGDVATPGDAKRAVLLAVFQMIISGGVMIAGATLAATVLNLNLGSMGRAALKLCGMAVFATGVASWVAVFDQGRYSVSGLMIALHIVVILYWIGFAYLFALELQETLLAVSIIGLLHAAASCALWKA